MAHVGSLLLLGASGDLAARLLMPALGELLEEEPQRRDLVLFGAGAEDLDADAWQDRVRTSFASLDVSEETIQSVLSRTQYYPADVTKAADLRKLIEAAPGPPAIYFALPPAVTEAACRQLQEVDLPEGTLLVLEKPFGTDEQTAHDLNALLATLVPDNQVFRVDHFLGRSSVLNLLGVRFANRLLEPLWNNLHIDRIDIVYDETLALENRARYYDRAGALVDMIQSHLLQILALVAMDPPANVNALDLRYAKATALRACRLWNDDPATAGKRARYTAGVADGEQVPDYTAEDGVDPARNTETLAEVTVEIDNWRWAGVPIRLRSGKALKEPRKEILVTFKGLPHLPGGLRGLEIPDMLRLSLNPDRMSFELNVNSPEDPLKLDRAVLTQDLNPGRLQPYGEVLAGVLDGDPLLAVRGDTAVECWRIVDPVLAAWRDNQSPMDTYAAGSDGPADWQY